MTAEPLEGIGRKYVAEVGELVRSGTTTEETYYPAIRNLLSELLDLKALPYRVRIATSEGRSGGGTDRPDVAIYGGAGTYLTVAGEVKAPAVRIEDLARSTERNNQVGRYLAQTGVVILSNVRSFGLLTVRPRVRRDPGRPVPPEDRLLIEVVNLWESSRTFERGRGIEKRSLQALADLLEQAVTEFAPIAEPEVLARVLALQARSAKADLPPRFEAVQGLLEDYRVALGLTFEGDEGREFFRSSLIQTAFYALFAGWTLWHRKNDGSRFEWERIDRYLKIPFLGKLFYEFRHPDRLEELHLAPHLDRAAETLGRVDRKEFFARFHTPSLLHELAHPEEADRELVASAITYFYEPFLEASDPDLRKELGVWYTPAEIVRYQVRRVDRLLRDELGCPRGLADEQVVVLDPCCGTGAYLIEVIRCLARQLKDEGEEEFLPTKILDAVCRRIVGFEILTAPFVIAQLQLYLILADLGATPEKGDRPAVFLTNALTGWGGPEQVKLNFPELKREHEAARHVKREARIIVVLGNPPYNRFAGAAMAEEADLVDHYKGIRRDEKDKQLGQSELFTRYGIRKQLLDDLYIRFIRLGEKQIGEHAEFGIVSFISNSSYLTGRSHPLMRESLLKNFHEIWIDNLNGDKYKTGKVIPKGVPGEGTADQSVFTTEQDARGIQVGTSISTFLKAPTKKKTGARASLHHRDFWGRAESKRRALLESLTMDRRPKTRKRSATDRPEGPRDYETVTPTEANRWMFAPRDVGAGFEAWPSVDELFPALYQGVNPNRGLDGSLIDMDRAPLGRRMQAYFDTDRFSEVREAAPALCQPRARYVPEEVWKALRKNRHYDNDLIKPYLLFPWDLRWIYYETDAKLLNEARSAFGENLGDNEFLVTVPQPRRVSETRPLLARTLVDLHVHDRGSICFPRRVRFGTDPESLFADGSEERRANMHAGAWEALKKAWGLKGDLAGKDAVETIADLFRLALAVMHSPSYERDHADGLAQDFAHLPIPRPRERFAELARTGDKVALLLDAQSKPDAVVREMLGDAFRTLGVPSKAGGGRIRGEEFRVTVSYYGSAQGKWRQRPSQEGEAPTALASRGTGDLFINNEVCFSNVPEPVWCYEIGGYPVLKKWLGYRQELRLGRAMTIPEVEYFRGMIWRIASLLVLHPELDRLYELAASDSFTSGELGLR